MACLQLTTPWAPPLPTQTHSTSRPAVGDYDGVVAQVDMESGHLIAEVDGHCGRRCD